MNITQLMRGLLGEPNPESSRALELKVGQIVRGVVLQTGDNQEALVQIAGVRVRAKLEVPMQPGQSTLLQVQPESAKGLVVLKPTSLEAVLPQETLKELAKSLGLPDKRWALDLLVGLRREGIPLDRALGRELGRAMAGMPKGAEPSEWMQAAATAYKRGLPMTEATISALRQVQFGKPLHELLATLQSQAAAFHTEAEAGPPGAPPSQARALAGALLRLLGDQEALLRLPEAARQAAGASAS
ncbi:DNA ligase, partial [Paenibacillus sp. IB182496]|nr:DNA ligase [Paenibacillus sabuli]